MHVQPGCISRRPPANQLSAWLAMVERHIDASALPTFLVSPSAVPKRQLRAAHRYELDTRYCFTPLFIDGRNRVDEVQSGRRAHSVDGRTRSTGALGHSMHRGAGTIKDTAMKGLGRHWRGYGVPVSCGAVVLLAACWTRSTAPVPTRPTPEAAPVVASTRSCDPQSREASQTPANGGYRRLDPTGMASLRTAIDDANKRWWGRTQRIGGRAFTALRAVVHDLHDEFIACATAADPSVQAPRYALEIAIDGHSSVGAVVDDVSVKRLVTILPGQPPTEVATSAQECIAQLLANIELPPSDGRGSLQAVFEDDGKCIQPGSRR